MLWCSWPYGRRDAAHLWPAELQPVWNLVVQMLDGYFSFLRLAVLIWLLYEAEIQNVEANNTEWLIVISANKGFSISSLPGAGDLWSHTYPLLKVGTTRLNISKQSSNFFATSAYEIIQNDIWCSDGYVHLTIGLFSFSASMKSSKFGSKKRKVQLEESSDEETEFGKLFYFFSCFK